MAGVIQSYALNLGLNEVPDDSIDPEVWRELQNIFQALKNLADSMDSGSHPGIAGTPGSQVKLQNYSIMYRTPSSFIPAGSVVMFNQGVPVLAGSANPYPDAYTETDAPAGVPSPFILTGVVYYPNGGLIPGARYYVNNGAPGTIVASPGAGRFVGQAFSSHTLFFDPQRF